MLQFRGVMIGDTANPGATPGVRQRGHEVPAAICISTGLFLTGLTNRRSLIYGIPITSIFSRIFFLTFYFTCDNMTDVQSIKESFNEDESPPYQR